ncbi:MAG: hypothetical protein KC478_08605 [Bacteriovoracaceae bacterium]|nr:hypothetical protein [Bacteriovoracaceae bacterium]
MIIVLILICLGLAALISKYLSIIPYNVIAGILFLIINSILELGASESVVSISLAFVFSCAALGSSHTKARLNKSFLSYSGLQYLLQWTLGLGLFLFVLAPFMGVSDKIVALSAPAGLAGGYGSAAFLGEVFKLQDRPEVFGILMFAATFGVLVSIVGSILLTRGKGVSFSSFSLNRYITRPLSYFLIIGVCGISYGVKTIIGDYAGIELPLFAISFIMALITKFMLRDKSTVSPAAVSNLSTDILIIAGIGSIKIHLLEDLLGPMLLVLSLAVVVGVLVFKFLGQRLSFEKALFTWGWSMGGIAIAIGIIQSIDSKKAQKVMQEFAPVYMILAPFELAALAGSSFLVSDSLIWPSFGVCLLISIALIMSLRAQVAENP